MATCRQSSASALSLASLSEHPPIYHVQDRVCTCLIWAARMGSICRHPNKKTFFGPMYCHEVQAVSMMENLPVNLALDASCTEHASEPCTNKCAHYDKPNGA